MKKIRHPSKRTDKAEPKWILNYRLEEVVGYGNWGKVKKGWDCEGERPVAVKILSKHRISRKIRDGIKRIHEEFNIIKSLNHPGIVKYYDLIETVKEDDECSTEDSSSEKSSLASYRSAGGGKIYLIMEWLGEGSNLTNANLKPEQLKSILRQLLEALQYLNQQGIAHHDIKLDNLIHDPQLDKLTLIDFGVAEQCTNDESFCGFGTPAYQPPELVGRLGGEEPISGMKVDIWSAGVVAFQLANAEKKLPFDGESINDVFDCILKREPKFDILLADPQLRSLIKGMLKKNPSKRLSPSEALNHAYFTGKQPSLWQRFKATIFM